MELNFCRRCGSALTSNSPTSYKCGNGHTIFANAVPTVGVFFLTPANELLLSVRGIEPHKGMLDSFGGFLDGAETFENGAVRELEEELGLTANDYEPLVFLASGTGNYLFEGETHPVVSSFFYTRLKEGVTPEAADDVAAIQTVSLHELNMDEVHDDDVRTGIRALQAKFPKENI
jgi:ADP-ribose pyrophosphatase YjhB (NUDIX family)